MQASPSNADVTLGSLAVTHRGESYVLPYFHRPGEDWPILYIHGLGCAKDDFRPMAECGDMAPFRLLAFDFPGCGGAPYPPGTALNVDDLVALTSQFVDLLRLESFVIVGHSMGGLIALLLCELLPSAIKGFVNVEGNLAPEDCMFSRKVAATDLATFEATLFPALKRDLASAHGAGFARYLATLEGGASPRAFHDYAEQTVHYSDHGKLLDRFLALPMPKLFVHGSENAALSYLPRLRGSDCAVAEIENADHLPFHDNPAAFSRAVARFVSALPSAS